MTLLVILLVYDDCDTLYGLLSSASTPSFFFCLNVSSFFSRCIFNRKCFGIPTILEPVE